MRLPYATVASFIAGGAAVGFATGTGLAPNPFGQSASSVPVVMEPDTSTIEKEASLDALTKELAERSTHLASLSASLNIREAELDKFAADLTARDTDLQDLQSTLQTREAALSDAETVLAALKTSLTEREETLALRETELSTMTAALTAEGDTAKIVPGPDEPQTEIVTAALMAEGDASKIIPPPGEAQTEQVALSVPATTASTPDTPAPAAVAATLEIDSNTPLAEVHFESASASLTPGGLNRALQAAERVASMNISKIRITGHTDTKGSPIANRALGKARAEAVAEIFVQSGLAREMIEIVGIGETASMLPIPTADGVAEPLNRCVGIFAVLDNGTVVSTN